MKQSIYFDKTVFRIIFPFLAGLIVYSLVLMVFDNLESLSDSFFSQEAFFSILVSYLVFETNLGLRKLSRKIGFLKSIHWNSILYRMVFSLSLNWIILKIAFEIYFTRVVGFSDYAAEFTTFFILFSILTFLYHLTDAGLLQLEIKNQESYRLLADLKQKAEQQTSVFKSSIHTGFLYNSLEILIELIHIDKKTAERLIEKLSHIYRYLLLSTHKEISPAKEEFRIARFYTEIINFKSPGSIQTELHDEEESGHNIIPGTIISLVEYICQNTIFSTNYPCMMQFICSKEKTEILSSARPVLNEEVSENQSEMLRTIIRNRKMINSPAEMFVYNVPVIKDHIE